MQKVEISLKEDLLSNPQEFVFQQAAYILHRLSEAKNDIGTSNSSKSEPIRIISNSTLYAPSSDIAKIVQFESKKFEMTVNFMGISGIQGPLSTPYVEMLFAFSKEKNFAPKDFLGMFEHKLVSIFYRIEKKYKPTLSLSLPQYTPQGKTLVAFSRVEALQKINPRSLMTTSAIFWQKRANPEGLKCIIKEIFNVREVEIEQFQGEWFKLKDEQLSYLGKESFPNNYLGKGVVVGEKVWLQNTGIDINIYANGYADFMTFLPGTEKFEKLKNVIKTYLGPKFWFRIGIAFKLDIGEMESVGNILLGWTSLIDKNRDYHFVQFSRKFCA